MPLQELQAVIHCVQALRRRAERLADCLQGATGVAGQLYPHQIQNVYRILAATSVRHLIADEVGMGKTVQALMVMNALRLQKKGKLRTLILVPQKEHRAQWATEILARAHTAPEDAPANPLAFVKVLHTAAIRAEMEVLRPDKCDLLIIDEPHRVSNEILDQVISRADEYQHLLLLTATPELRSTAKCDRLLRLLEPQRTALFQESGGDLTTTLRQQQDAAWQGLLPEEETWLADLDASARQHVMTESWWLYRRVLRSRRRDFPRHLARRELETRWIEPLQEEFQRCEVLWRFLRAFQQRTPGPEGRDRAALIARRAVLSGVSLRERLSSLRIDENDPEELLAYVQDVTQSKFGDSRLDELVDWLLEFWQSDPTRKVLVAAQDNPTIDYLQRELARRLPEVGPRGARESLQIICAREVRDDPGATNANAILESIAREFAEGSAQLLIAHDAFRESCNLQAAEAIVFFGLPWDPLWVEQWIGRVDRLGREVVNRERASSEPLPVRVVSLVRRGQPDERVWQALDRHQVLEQSHEPDPIAVQVITDEVYAAGLQWNINQPAGNIGDDDAEDEPADLLTLPWNAWTSDDAVRLWRKLVDEPAMEPVLRQVKPNGYVSSSKEEGLSRWLELMNEQELFRIFSNRDPEHPNDRSRRYHTFSRRANEVVDLEMLRGLAPPPWLPFFVARNNIQRPPRTDVLLENVSGEVTNQVRRRLEFLDHGSRLHEEVIDAFIQTGQRIPIVAIRLSALGKRHFAADTPLQVGRYIVAVGLVDAGDILDSTSPFEDFRKQIPETDRVLRKEMQVGEMRRLITGYESDARCVRMHLPARLVIKCWQSSSTGALELVTNLRVGFDLLTIAWKADEKPKHEAFGLSTQQLQQLRERTRLPLVREAVASWKLLLPGFRQVVVERERLVQIEMAERLELLRRKYEEVKLRSEQRERAEDDASRMTNQLVDRPQLELLEEQLKLVELARDMRCESLRQVLAAVDSPNATHVQMQTVLVIDLQNDLRPIPTDSKVTG